MAGRAVSLSDVGVRIQQGAEEILRLAGHPEGNVSAGLNKVLRSFLSFPYSAGPVAVRELEGANDQVFGSAIYTGNAGAMGDAVAPVSAGNVACAFHVERALTPEALRVGYQQIAAVKRVRRPLRASTEYPVNDVPLGIIFCTDSQLPLERVGEAMIELNKTVPSTEWPDMVVVLRKGTLNYAVQFEGDKIRGNFLLPNTRDFPVMPMYVHVFARGVGIHSLNRMCGFLFLHLGSYSPGTKLPDKEAVEGVSSVGMTLGGYQFNLSRELVPVPDEMRTDKGAGLRNLPFRIESHSGELLSHVRFIPWQDGGAVRVIGKMPLESVLVFLGPVMKQAQIIQQENARISSVLPISRGDFLRGLQRLQARSNMVVKPERPSWIVSKISDEGSSTPFMARLFMGVLQIRDRVFLDSKERDSFDKPYESTLASLSDARSTAKEIDRLLDEHKSKVSTGEAARLLDKTIQVDGIDKELRKHTVDFVTSAARSLKQGMQSVAKSLGLDIGFFFKDRGQFEKGLAKLSGVSPELADYLGHARGWAERLNLLRNRIEHEGWTLPRTGYRASGERIDVVEPEVDGERVSKFVREMLNRLCCFVEEVTVYALRAKMDPAISVEEIPLRDRDPAAPERFRPALVLGGASLWKLSYHAFSFDDV
jgi:hypothetical protein